MNSEWVKISDRSPEYWMNMWINLSEKFPPKDIPILATNGARYHIAILKNNLIECEGHYCGVGKDTHWMALPKLPLIRACTDEGWHRCKQIDKE